MSTERLPQVNQLIKKELSRIMLRGADFPEGVLVTLTRVETSANLIQTKAYISVMPQEMSRDVLKTLRGLVYEFQQKLNSRLKMRPVPKIIFMEEKQTAEAGRIEELLEEIHTKKS